ncbi:MAG: SGNH/GDSL hydrolase family protein [Pedobacter sp.]|nr:MAG: SGNH/GDSL hydrolase family protein [Pedobacter sp.]
MKLMSVIIGLFLLLACKKGNTTVMDNAQQKPVTPIDTAKKPVTPAKPTDTVKPKPADPNKGKQLNYIALGDSYTIGEAVNSWEAFPYQLAGQLNAGGLIINPPKLIARTGWTTSELKEAIASSGVIQKFDFVTLLIGVNNQYRGESKDTYRKEFKELLQIALNYVNGNKTRVFVVSIPDWGVTNFAKQSGRNQKVISAEIDAFNAINKEETVAMGVSYTDITPGSRLAVDDTSLIANDGLHPSAKMYRQWSDLLSPKLLQVFK